MYPKIKTAKRTDQALFLLALFLLGVAASAQNAQTAAAPPVSPAAPAVVLESDAALQRMLAPIALYPDALIAQILPASSYPLQIVVAARWLQANPSPSRVSIDAQDLEPSVKALLHYPTIIAMMDNRVLWTQLLGSAFVNQQAQVMTAIQELRAEAKNAGSLQSNAEQQVVTDNDNVEIVPADPNVIYVPDYDPTMIYDGSGSAIEFGLGYPEGLWLDNGTDWRHRWISGGDGWQHGWDRPGDAGARAGAKPPLTRPWERDSAQPLPVRVPRAIQISRRAVGPGYEAAGTSARVPDAFEGYQDRSQLQRGINRAQQSMPAPQRSYSEPQNRAQPEHTQVFRVQGNGPSVSAQSARGNASRGSSGGGGSRSSGGGGHSGGGGRR